LAKTGATIRIATRDPEKVLLLKPMGDVGQIVPVPCSQRSDASVAKAIGRSDVIINLTGILFEKGRDTFQSVHVEAAARMARLAKEAGIKYFLHMSALGADEQATSHYGRSKAAGEEAVRTFFPGAVIFRPSIVFGPEDNFFNKFAAMARISPALPLIGGGATKFQPVYVGDVADAMSRALENKQCCGQLYELGGPQTYSFRELLEVMLHEINRKRYLVNMPWGLAKLKAAFLELMPQPLLTRDQVDLLKRDNVVSSGTKTFRDLGIHPTALELVLPTYLGRFRSAGRSARKTCFSA
jgi:NADH dehydrogenase